MEIHSGKKAFLGLGAIFLFCIFKTQQFLTPLLRSTGGPLAS